MAPAGGPDGAAGGLPVPSLVLAADHRARGVVTVERYRDYVGALASALPSCDGVLATAQPLEDLVRSGAVGPRHRTYLSLNRTGLAGTAFELDDRLVATVARAADDGWTGVKHMTRIDRSDPLTAGALELLGQVLESARRAGLEALVESVVWRDGAMARDTDSIVYAAVVAHDLGAPLLKVPVPDEPAGEPRAEAVARVVAAVGVPVLFLGGPRRTASDRAGSPDEGRRHVLDEVRDVMAGGGAGMAIGRTVYQDPDPAGMARTVAAIVHGYERPQGVAGAGPGAAGNPAAGAGTDRAAGGSAGTDPSPAAPSPAAR
jgi:DhnA family fructose-bisphosphate aldolase class Ia